MEPLGLYISVPFCRAKCSFCNFASGVFAAGRMQRYADRLCAEITGSRATAERLRAELPGTIDSIYFGGGTPSLLEPRQLRQIFETIRPNFTITPGAEITLEAAPGQIAPATLDEMQRQGVNRISFGVQSFVDAEATAIGRLHTRAMCVEEIARMGAAGLQNISIDLIAGLPHQTEASWSESLREALALAIPHISVYMLEVDEDSRLGREVLAGGTRFHAHFVPDADISANLYTVACERLNGAGVAQYEISNFAVPGYAARHNQKYWDRRPYLGVGLDAHSMLRAETTAVRFCNTDDMDDYENSAAAEAPNYLSQQEAFEESLFLGLRRVEGLSPAEITQEFGSEMLTQCTPAVRELEEQGLLITEAGNWRLTHRGRLLSNEVFSRLLLP